MSFSSLRSRFSRDLGLWIVVLAVVLLVGVVVLTYLAYRQAATELVLGRDEQLTVLSAARLTSDLSDYGDLLAFLARSPEMSGGGVATQLASLRAAAPRLTVFDGGVALLDSRGRVRGTVPERLELIARDWSERDFFQAMLGEAPIFVSNAQQVWPNEPPVIAIAVPILGEDDAFVGVLAGMFRLGEPTLSAFYASIVKLRLGSSGRSSVVDGQGRIVYASDPERVGRFLTSGELSRIAPPIPVAELTRDRAGKAVVAAWAPVPGTNWTLIVEEDWSQVTSSAARYRDILLLSFIAAMLLPPLGLALFSRQRRFEIRRPEDDDSWVRTLRQHLQPTQVPVLPGWSLAVRQEGGKRIEHEFSDVGLLPDGRLMLAMGKISARGIQAALALASTRALVRSCAMRLKDVGETLHQCNSYLCAQFAPPFALRGLYLVLEPRLGRLDYSLAGVSPPRSTGTAFVQDGPVLGTPMGTNPQGDFEVGQVRLKPGDLLVLLGPSMLEARDPDGIAFSGPPLARILAEGRQGPYDLTERIIEGFKTFNAKSALLSPDLTVVVLERAARRS